MDPRYDPHLVAGPWTLQQGATSPVDNRDGDEGLVGLAGWMLCLIAALPSATVALVIGGLSYALATWRRWRWWPLALVSTVTLLLVLAVSGPADALHRHLLPLRELTTPHAPSLTALILDRWPAWISAQLPLSLPLGLLLAALGRHQVTHIAAHELSPRARRRRDAEDRAQLAAAIRRSASAPAPVGEQPVLGAWAGGDLNTWRAGPWCVLPESALGLGTLLIGLPGAGKTETLLRLAEIGLESGYDVHVIDAKGDVATQDRFAALAAGVGVEAKLFPDEPYDGFRGDPDALRNRLTRIVDYTEPYYQDGARVLLSAACTSPLGSLDELLVRLATAGDVDQAVRKGTLSRYRSFAAAVGDQLTGHWAFEDTRASYLLLDGLALGDDTPRLARYLLEDFTHFCTSRKPPERKVLLLVDEFSALRLGNAAALFERLRSFNAGVVLAAQSVEGLHDDEAERDRLLNSASTLIAHRLADPDPIVTRAGTTKRAERSHQLDPTGATGMGSLRLQDTYRIDPNDLRSLPPGVAWIVTGGRACKVAISRGGQALALPQRNRRFRRGPQDPGPSRRGPRRNRAGGPGDPALPPHRAGSAGTPALVRANVGEKGLEEPATRDRLPAVCDTDDGAVYEAEAVSGVVGEGSDGAPSKVTAGERAAAENPTSARSPYAQGL